MGPTATRGSRRLAVAVFACLAGSCAGKPVEPAVAEPRAESERVESERAADGDAEHGIASYYSSKLKGRKTASGERYDPKALTAAHKTLPFGTLVDVRREDGRHVRVRINDRGPFVKGRVVDLSYEAAKEIGLLKDGVAKVSLSVVESP